MSADDELKGQLRALGSMVFEIENVDPLGHHRTSTHPPPAKLPDPGSSLLLAHVAFRGRGLTGRPCHQITYPSPACAPESSAPG